MSTTTPAARKPRARKPRTTVAPEVLTVLIEDVAVDRLMEMGSEKEETVEETVEESAAVNASMEVQMAAEAAEAAKDVTVVEVVDTRYPSDLLTDPRKVAMVEAVVEFAKANYEKDGWDIVVETMTAEEIAKVVYLCRTPAGAVRKIHAIVATMDEVRRDVQEA